MRSELAKVLHRAGGRTLIEHVIRACLPLKAAQVLVVVGHQADEVGAVAENLGAQVVLQKPQHGTGHAMQVARRAIRKSAKVALVVPGDAPLLRSESLVALLDAHRRGEAAATVLSAELEDPTDYGRIVRDATCRSATTATAASPARMATSILPWASRATAALRIPTTTAGRTSRTIRSGSSTRTAMAPRRMIRCAAISCIPASPSNPRTAA